MNETNDPEKTSPEMDHSQLSEERSSAPVNPDDWNRPQLDLTKVQMASDRIRKELHKVIVGQDDFIDELLVALYAGGHVLVEGVPGIAKTLTAKLLAQAIDVGFSRIQFTPDLMPSDVVGTTVFNMQSSEFSFNPGPIFSQIVLIDEINRAPAKTQAALFEVMEELQVTVDGNTYKMEFPFFVMATQNPIEQEGTYKLPEAQLDRFLLKINLEYPKLEEEQAILRRFRNDFTPGQPEDINKVFHPEELKQCRRLIEQVYIKDELLDYIAAMVHHTRNSGDLYLGASPRASLAILRASKAYAAIQGRDFVTPDDIQYVAYPALNHRIILTPEREMEGYLAKDVIKDIIQKIEVPR